MTIRFKKEVSCSAQIKNGNNNASNVNHRIILHRQSSRGEYMCSLQEESALKIVILKHRLL